MSFGGRCSSLHAAPLVGTILDRPRACLPEGMRKWVALEPRSATRRLKWVASAISSPAALMSEVLPGVSPRRRAARGGGMRQDRGHHTPHRRMFRRNIVLEIVKRPPGAEGFTVIRRRRVVGRCFP